ncbi:hypothetical protein GYA37_01995 [candidate division WWE3 bacterium]|uniref:Type II secretion system protein n=1 Tax=candidate division WWE3 bacterium TaxID=2053526 RepID=A0A7X9E7B1_UNCKA|nr:hypothetical protein [candidate division WWE3 bacterium]
MSIRKKEKRKERNQDGIALVEVIASIGIAVVVITSLVSLSISTLRTSLKSKLLLEGSKIANRELELVRAYRDNSISWEQFISDIRLCDTGCSMFTDGSGITPQATVENADTTEALARSFTATTPEGFQLTPGVDNIARISVSVTWTVGGEIKGTYLYTDLTNWRSE